MQVVVRDHHNRLGQWLRAALLAGLVQPSKFRCLSFKHYDGNLQLDYEHIEIHIIQFVGLPNHFPLLAGR